MDQVCLVVPVQARKSDDARAFMRELEEQRKDAYAQSEQRIGIDKEVWFLARADSSDLLVSYMESPDFANALRLFSASQDEFDLWFKRRFADSTSVDLNNPPEMTLPELLSSYSSADSPGLRSPRATAWRIHRWA